MKIPNTFILIISLIAGLSFVLIDLSYDNGVYHLVYGPLAFMITTSIAAFEFNYKPSKFFAKVSGVLGDASYGIYLIHPLVVSIILLRDVLSCILIILITIFTAVIMNRFVENNLLNFVRQKLLSLINSIKQKIKGDSSVNEFINEKQL